MWLAAPGSTQPVPLPNDEIDGATVIASVPWDDDLNQWSVVLLHKKSPFFQCAKINANTGDVIERGVRHHNIVPAVDEYADQWGGDY